MVLKVQEYRMIQRFLMMNTQEIEKDPHTQTILRVIKHHSARMWTAVL